MKFDVLENAGWPVLLVKTAGQIAGFNPAARLAWGFMLQQSPLTLESLWGTENQGSASQFLSCLDRCGTASVTLKMRLEQGGTATYNAYVCSASVEGVDGFLFQLFPENNLRPGIAATTTAAALPVGLDPNLAHKQKLDCALQLARTVALDFKNALTSILGHASLLLSKGEATHPWRSSLVEIEKSAAKAAEIADDLASFSRQEKDNKVQAAGNLNQLLQRTIDAFRPSQPGTIEFTLHVERRLFTASFDEAKMQQAIVKIFENAVQSLPGNGSVHIQTRNLELSEPTTDRTAKLPVGNYVCVEISDNGSGIHPEVLPRVFEPFFTTKRGGNHRGLGLAWVYGIVTNHGGGVAVSSQVGVGTSVRIYLPANKSVIKEFTPANDNLNGSGTLLFVDDEDLLLTMADAILSSYGYEVITANNGPKALELFLKNKKPIDLVITDLVMPTMSGRELVERIRASHPDTRIIYSSGYVRAKQNEGNEAYLQKPFTSQDLLRKVKQALTT